MKDIKLGNFKLKNAQQEIREAKPKNSMNADKRQFKVNLQDLLTAKKLLKPLQKTYNSDYIPLQQLLGCQAE